MKRCLKLKLGLVIASGAPPAAQRRPFQPVRTRCSRCAAKPLTVRLRVVRVRRRPDSREQNLCHR